jgi:hypothetical protein
MKNVLTTNRNTMKYLLVALVALVVLDGILTEYLVGGGLARESNPILEPLVGGTGFMLLKIIGSLVCAFILWDIYRHFPKMAVIAAWVFTIGYALIVIWNTSLFLIG